MTKKQYLSIKDFTEEAHRAEIQREQDLATKAMDYAQSQPKCTPAQDIILDDLAHTEGRTKEDILLRALGIYTEHDRIHFTKPSFSHSPNTRKLKWL